MMLSKLAIQKKLIKQLMVLAKQRIDKFGFDIIESSQVSLEDAVRQKEGC